MNNLLTLIYFNLKFIFIVNFIISKVKII